MTDFLVTYVDDNFWRTVRSDGSVECIDGPRFGSGSEFSLWQIEDRRVAFFLDAPDILPTLESMNVDGVVVLSEIRVAASTDPHLIASGHSEIMPRVALAAVAAVGTSSHGVMEDAPERLKVTLGDAVFDVAVPYDYEREGWSVRCDEL